VSSSPEFGVHLPHVAAIAVASNTTNTKASTLLVASVLVIGAGGTRVVCRPRVGRVPLVGSAIVVHVGRWLCGRQRQTQTRCGCIHPYSRDSKAGPGGRDAQWQWMRRSAWNTVEWTTVCEKERGRKEAIRKHRVANSNHPVFGGWARIGQIRFDGAIVCASCGQCQCVY